MKLFYVLCAIPAASAFMVQGPQFQGKTSLASSNNEYVNTLNTGAQNKRGPNQDLDQRLGDLARMEKQLEQRLTDLSRTEKNLEARLSNLARQERTVGGRQGIPDRKDYQSAPTYGSNMKSIDEIWETSQITTVQGGSLRTWSFANPAVNRVYVLLKTDGRPLDADVELWQGPDNTPHKMKVYVEDGGARTFSTFIDTPRSPNTVCIKNTGHLEFPLYGCVGPDKEAGESCLQTVRRNKGEIIQGGALRTYAFEPMVNSVAVMIKTDGRPLNARIELLQGPNNNKQVLALYTEDGLERPFLAIIQTPGSGNVVRIVNTAPVEFPMHATVVEHEISSIDAYAADGIQIGQEW